MTTQSKAIRISTKGNCDMIDITGQIAKEIAESNINSGIATIFITGSTAGVTTIEYESGVIRDYKDMWDRNVPLNISYQHDQRWGDGNGYSHVRASLQSPSLVVPFTNKKMMLGTWQQIVVLDFDNRARSREIVLQLLGE
ncbi:MAG: secondary thiamine-phosphate synthase enzyme YjbQ [Dehalococcoidia bacterium]|jgi:secondary thiamine-phosphate synthase enzyme